MEVTVPVIRNYRCYREFMRESYSWKKAGRVGFSYRRFSQLVGLKSPNYLQMVMSGKRNLSNDLAPKVARVLCVSASEQAYFVGLVKQHNAANPRELEDANHEIMVAVKRMISKEIPRGQEAILTHWYFMVIRELTFLPDFQPDGAWIARKLRDLITPEQAVQGLETLLKCGFLREGPKGKFGAVDPVIDTPEVIDRERIMHGHTEMLLAWTKILPRIEPADREVGFLNIPIARRKLPEFKERIRRFQDEIIGWLHDEAEPDLVVQLGTYLVPITTAD